MYFLYLYLYVHMHLLYVLHSSAPFQTLSELSQPCCIFGVPESSPSASHWDMLVLQEPGSLSIPTRLPWAPCSAPEPVPCLHCKHDTCHTPWWPRAGGAPGDILSWGLLRALCHPPKSGFTDGFLSFSFQGLSRACGFNVQHGSRRGILSQDFLCISYGPA